jgi:hypothetical protein
MAEKSKPVPPKSPVIKVQTPVIKPNPMPGTTYGLTKVQDSVDRTKSPKT